MSRVATIFLLALLPLALTPTAYAADGDMIAIKGLPAAAIGSLRPGAAGHLVVR